MKTTVRNIRRIARYEGFVDHPYKPVKGEQFWTWGYGHYGPDVPHPSTGRKISKERAFKLLVADVRRFEKGVNALIKTRINQNRFDALVSLAFNIGLGNFKSSTVLRETNARHFTKAARAFLLWNKGGVPLRVLPGLVIRRTREAALYLRPVVRKKR